jgi:hypothetical protein
VLGAGLGLIGGGLHEIPTDRFAEGTTLGCPTHTLSPDAMTLFAGQNIAFGHTANIFHSSDIDKASVAVYIVLQ